MVLAAVAAQPGISKTTPVDLQITVNGLASADVLTASFVYGKSTAAPATYAGLANPSNPITLTVDQFTQLTSRFIAAGSTYQMIGTDPGGAIANAAWTVGDHVWLCLFDNQTPSGSDVPLATAGPFLVTA